MPQTRKLRMGMVGGGRGAFIGAVHRMAATLDGRIEPAARAALLGGFPVMCDKPLALNLAEARELRALVRKTGLLFGLTHNYSGYPMVKEARHRVAAGELGRIRRVVAEYPQGWLSSALEATGQKQAEWRTDPARAGAGPCLRGAGTPRPHPPHSVAARP